MIRNVIGLGKRKFLALVVSFGLLGFAVAVDSAHAVFISGSVSFSDGFQGTTGDANSVVSQLVSVNVVNTAGVAVASGCSGAFVGCTSGTAQDFTIGTVPVVMYSVVDGTTFTFTATAFSGVVRTALSCVGGFCTDSILFNVTGTVSGAGFDTTNFAGNWTANGACQDAAAAGPNCTAGTNSASWSSSNVALGTPGKIPEPSSMLLVGAGLVGLAAWARKRK